MNRMMLVEDLTACPTDSLFSFAGEDSNFIPDVCTFFDCQPTPAGLGSLHRTLLDTMAR
jgi:hypothetical protein